MAESDFNVLTHTLVPEHHLMSEEEAQQKLSELKITKDQLPKIRKGRLHQVLGVRPHIGGRIIGSFARAPPPNRSVYRLVVKDG